jgi:hypothetical protein
MAVAIDNHGTIALGGILDREMLRRTAALSNRANGPAARTLA